MIELYVFVIVSIVTFLFALWTDELYGVERILVPICVGAMGYGFTGIFLYILNHVRIV